MVVQLMSTKTFIATFILFSSCFFFVNSQIDASKSLLDPLIPDLLNFLDIRLTIILPIIQTFKDTIISDPLGITDSWVGPNICDYKGFYCDNPPDNHSATSLASIDFNGFQLSAPSLEGFIDQLPDLAIFHANSNNFSGTIPSSVAKLPFLYELDLSNNNLYGDFPTLILLNPNLLFLDIRFNSFSGSIPQEIFSMDTLITLFLNNNNFMQQLPDDFGSTQVRYLTLANNKLSGPIPRSIIKTASTLTEVLLLNNQLTDCIPYELGFLTELVLFDASNNQLTGQIPSSLVCLGKIEQLNLARNLLYGEVPESLCSLQSLANLSLAGNYFTKVGPLCKKLVKSGALDVKGNCIVDLPDQRSISECSEFFAKPSRCERNHQVFGSIPDCKNPPTLNNHKNAPTSNEHNHVHETGHKRRLLVTYNALSRHSSVNTK